MGKASIDRWTDTIVFRAALFCSGVLVLPVLALGLLTTLWMLVFASRSSEFSVLDGGPVALLSLGGGLGILGLLRAHRGTKEAARRDIAGTLVCLAIGIATALGVAGLVAADLVADALEFGWQRGSWISALFVAAHVCWVLWGVGSMQKLTRRYVERTGRAFHGEE
jgi:amino acid transporter